MRYRPRDAGEREKGRVVSVVVLDLGRLRGGPRKGEGEVGWRVSNGERRWKLKNRCGWDRNRNLEMRRLNGE